MPTRLPSSLLLVISAVLVCALAVLQATIRYAQINPDGVSYLDIGEAVLRGEIAELANPLWSPLYSVLAAAAECLGESVGMPVFGALTLLNALQFAFAAYLYTHLTRVLLGGGTQQPLVRSAQVFVSLGLFCSFYFLTSSLAFVTPDLTVCIFLLLIAIQALKISGGAVAPREFLIAGILLGASYWVKAILLPLSLIWLAALFWRLTRKQSPHALRCALFLAIPWLVMTLPLVTAVSLRAGRPSFSEAGRLNYLWHVNGIPNRLWDGGSGQFGALLHQPRLIHKDPAAYAFGDAFPTATYAVWYDPAYWYRGAKPRFDPAGMSEVLRQGVGGQRRLWLSRYMLPLTLLAILGLLLRSGRHHPGAPILLVVSVALIGMLLLVHYEPRYVTASVLLVMAVGLSALYQHGRSIWPLGPGIAALVAVGIYGFAVSYVKAGETRSRFDYALAAESLHNAGLQRGDRLCVISKGMGSVGNVAKAAGLRIVAESPLEAYLTFLIRNHREPETLLESFQAEGCKAVLVHPFHPNPRFGGWKVVQGTGQHFQLLTPRGVR